jgi:hypothetical protein
MLSTQLLTLENGAAEAKELEHDQAEGSGSAAPKEQGAPSMALRSMAPVGGFEDEVELQLSYLLEAYTHQVHVNAAARQRILTTMANACNSKFDPKELSARAFDEQSETQKLYAELYGRCERCGDLHCQHKERKRVRWVKQKYHQELHRMTDRTSLERPKRTKPAPEEEEEEEEQEAAAAAPSTSQDTGAEQKAAVSKPSPSTAGRRRGDTARKRARPARAVAPANAGWRPFVDPMLLAHGMTGSHFPVHFQQQRQQYQPIVSAGVLPGIAAGQHPQSGFAPTAAMPQGVSSSATSQAAAHPMFPRYGGAPMLAGHQMQGGFGAAGQRTYPYMPNYDMQSPMPQTTTAAAAAAAFMGANAQRQQAHLASRGAAGERRSGTPSGLSDQLLPSPIQQQQGLAQPQSQQHQQRSSSPYFEQIAPSPMVPPGYGYGPSAPHFQRQSQQQQQPPLYPPRPDAQMWMRSPSPAGRDAAGPQRQMPFDSTPSGNLAPHAARPQQLTPQQQQQLLQFQYQLRLQVQQHQMQHQMQQQQQQQQQLPQTQRQQLQQPPRQPFGQPYQPMQPAPAIAPYLPMPQLQQQQQHHHQHQAQGKREGQAAGVPSPAQRQSPLNSIHGREPDGAAQASPFLGMIPLPGVSPASGDPATNAFPWMSAQDPASVASAACGPPSAAGSSGFIGHEPQFPSMMQPWSSMNRNGEDASTALPAGLPSALTESKGNRVAQL